MSVFVDTNVFLAATDAGESQNARARDVLIRITGDGPFTTDHVLVEAWAMLRKRLGWDTAERFLANFRGSPVAVEPVGAADLERAVAIGELWADQKFDLVDRTSMAVMERLGCSSVASFDRDFGVYRYGPDRRLAFDVIT
ncbi:MAG: type II toxin-antitoxin system VapC family toxin [Actinomycetota bacterium]|nr:PIN domain-containing protein [Actinomycetota bacterium]